MFLGHQLFGNYNLHDVSLSLLLVQRAKTWKSDSSRHSDERLVLSLLIRRLAWSKRLRRKGETNFLELNLCFAKFNVFFLFRSFRATTIRQSGDQSPSLSAEFLPMTRACQRKNFLVARDKLIESFFGVGNLHFKFSNDSHFHCQSKAKDGKVTRLS